MEKGWDATGCLARYWKRVGGRDGLADVTGIQPSTISGYNTGRLRLGITNGERIAQALGVTIFELGAPTAEEAAAGAVTLLERVEALEAELADARLEIDDLRRQQGDVT
jgi:transcriptional regulator with XRE-family HTH domain